MHSSSGERSVRVAGVLLAMLSPSTTWAQELSPAPTTAPRAATPAPSTSGTTLAPTPAASAGPTTSAGPAYTPTAMLGWADALRAVQQHASALVADRLEVDLARSEQQQQHLLPNPSVDLGWSTIPLGTTNPPDLRRPFLNIPSYSVGLSATFPLGKRGPRQARASASVEAAQAGYRASSREQALGLVRTVARLAAARLRRAGLEGLIEQSKGTVDLARSRVNAGQGIPLEVDRLEIDQGRLEQQMLAAEADERTMLAACAPFVGVPCAPFTSGEEARGFLQSWIDQAQRLDGDVEQRPEAQALVAQRRGADAEARLARATALPDLTVRLGYVYDAFIISGDQRNSLNLSLSMPLPIFDRGQAAVAAAEARQRRTEEQRQKLVASDRARLAPLRESLERQRQRQQSVVTRLLPRARAVLTDLEKATSGRLLPLTEVLPARRVVNELLIEEADSLLDTFDNALEITALLAPLTLPRETP